MPKAQVVHKLVAPNVKQWQEWSVSDPEPVEVRLRQTAIGVNFTDIRNLLLLVRVSVKVMVSAAILVAAIVNSP